MSGRGPPRLADRQFFVARCWDTDGGRGTASAAALYFANLFGLINSVLFLLDRIQSATASLARVVS